MINKLTKDVRIHLVEFGAALRTRDGISADDVVRKMIEQEAEERFGCYPNPKQALRMTEISRLATPEERAAEVALDGD